MGRKAQMCLSGISALYYGDIIAAYKVDISVSAEYVVTAFRSELNGVRMQYFSQFLFTISVGLDPTLFPFPLS